jgi:hypothetical protein
MTNRCTICNTELWDYLRDVPVTTCPGCGFAPGHYPDPPAKVVALKVVSRQADLSCRLMDELRTVMLNPEYDALYISTLLGVLVMLQHESLDRIRQKI